ncbi:MAG: tetratricopeptide repeat protein, partial [Promethearchaeota archaeon]
TKEDFLENSNLKELKKSNTYPLFKIHGSKHNIITKKDTHKSVVTRISDYGKNREGGRTFSLESYKKPLIKQLMDSRILIILGYSGSDDFDIGPTLKELTDLQHIIWIEHSTEEDFEIIELFQAKPSATKIREKKSSSLEKSEANQLQEQIVASTGGKIYKIKTNTATFVENFLCPLLLANKNPTQLKEIIKMKEKGESFHETISKGLKKISEIEKYSLITEIYFNFQLHEDVLRTAEIGLSLCKKSDIDSEKLPFLNHLGRISLINGEIERASSYFDQIEQIANSISDLKYQIISEINKGLLNNYQGKNEIALISFEHALELNKELNDEKLQLSIFNSIAGIYSEQGEDEDAIKFYKDALETADKIGSLSAKATILNNLAIISASHRLYGEAIENLKEAVKILIQMGENLNLPTIFANIGSLHEYQGDLYKALKNYEKALNIAEKYQIVSDIGTIKINLGDLYKKWGQYPIALQQYHEASKILSKSSSPIKEAAVNISIGSIYEAQGDYGRAMPNFEHALEIAENLNNPALKISALANIAKLKLDQNKLDQAFDQFQQVKELVRQHKDPLYEAVITFYTGLIHKKREMHQKALECFRSVIQTYQNNNYIEGEIKVNINIGEIEGILGNYSQAFSKLKEALDMADKFNTRPLLGDIFHKMGNIYHLQKDDLNAQQYWERAMSIYHQLQHKNDIAEIKRKFEKIH